MSAPSSLAGRPTLRIRGVSYPVFLPSWRDPRLHLASVIFSLHMLGQVAFNFRLSIPQIVASILTCALLEVGITFWQKRDHPVAGERDADRATASPSSCASRAPSTGTGGASTALWIYIAVAAVSLLSKYLIRFRGRHVFNPSNFGLVLCFLVLGSTPHGAARVLVGAAVAVARARARDDRRRRARRSSRACTCSASPCCSG